jgi:OmpA-OmpF porin, OOP family
MRIPRNALVLVAAAVGLAMALPEPADGQILRRLRDAASNAAEREVTRQVETRVTNMVRCAFDDLSCIQRAEEEGRPVAYVDDRGQVIVDASGEPVTDRDQAAQVTVIRPGEGAWANWDFVPGEEVLLVDDFQADRVGDFPRRWELMAGNFEIVEWEGGRYVQASADGLVALPLPRTLPDRFTVEFSLSLSHGNSAVFLTTAPYLFGPRRGDFQGSAVHWARARAGIDPVGGMGPEIRAPIEAAAWDARVVPVRVMADGDHMKVYWDDRRIANAPNAVFPRGDTLYLAFRWARDDAPVLMGPLRIAGGGLELYDRLARDGRVATQGILFATGSDRIRPESTPVLQEIVAMLEAHADLRLRIEGHTDDVGDDAMNQELSERRAASVRAWLVSSGGVAGDRLETVGFGETRPAVEGTTAEAREQNRRVELVDLRGGGI